MNSQMKNLKEKHRYVFPNILAKTMKNVPMNVQLESSMAASSMILLGMILMSILLMFFTQQTIAFKIITLLNLVGAFIFISSSLVTTYQQYVNFSEVMDLQKSMALQGSLNGMPDLAINDLNMNHKINRKNQVLFFGGLLLIIVPLFLGGWIDSLLPEMIYAKYLIMGAGIFIGISMIYFAVRKKKVRVIRKRPIVSIPQQKPEAPRATYIKRPAQPVPMEQPVYIQQAPAPKPGRLGAKTDAEKAEILQKVKEAGGVREYLLSLGDLKEDSQQPANAPAPTLRFKQASSPAHRPIPQSLPQNVYTPSKPIQRPQERPLERSQEPQRQQQLVRQPNQRIQRANRLMRSQTQEKPSLLKRFGASKKNKKVNMLNDIEKNMEEKLYEINMLKAKQR